MPFLTCCENKECFNFYLMFLNAFQQTKVCSLGESEFVQVAEIKLVKKEVHGVWWGSVQMWSWLVSFYELVKFLNDILGEISAQRLPTSPHGHFDTDLKRFPDPRHLSMFNARTSFIHFAWNADTGGTWGLNLEFQFFTSRRLRRMPFWTYALSFLLSAYCCLVSGCRLGMLITLTLATD